MFHQPEFAGRRIASPMKISRPIPADPSIMILSSVHWVDGFREHFNKRPDTMISRNETRAAEIKMAEAELKGLLDARTVSEISNDRYYTDGSKTRDDAAIFRAREKVRELKKDPA